MEINCSYDELVEVHKLVKHPKNPNNHPQDQIERLAKIIDYQGQRSPLIVSKQSGFIVVGHGRLEAMNYLGWEKVAVNFQDFENDAQEYAHMTADNAISEWASLDLSQINRDFLELGPDLDVELMGFKKFEIEPLDKIDDIAPLEDDEINEACNFRIKCENLAEVAIIQERFGITGDSVSFQKFNDEFLQ